MIASDQQRRFWPNLSPVSPPGPPSSLRREAASIEGGKSRTRAAARGRPGLMSRRERFPASPPFRPGLLLGASSRPTRYSAPGRVISTPGVKFICLALRRSPRAPLPSSAAQRRRSGGACRSRAPGCRFQHHIQKAGFLLKRELCCFLQHIRKAGNQVKTCSCCL